MLITLCLATCCGYTLWLWRNCILLGPQPKAYPGALPIIGHLHLFRGKGTDLWKRLKDVIHYSLEQGGVASINLGLNTIYVLTDPDDCLTVANTCLDKHYVYNFARPLIGQGLLTADVPTWKRDRKLLNPAFKQQTLNGFMEIFNNQSRRLVSQFAAQVGNGPFKHINYLMNITLETICLTALGLDLGNEVVSKKYPQTAGQVFKSFTNRFQQPWMHSDFVFKWTSIKKEQDKAIKYLIDISSKVIKTRKLERKNKTMNQNDILKQSDKFKSILDLLLDISEETNAFTDQEIREQIDSMIVAGYDTTATTLMFTMILIGTHREVQDRVYKELQEVFENSERDVDKYDLPKLIYLEAVIKESLRVYPLVPIMARNNYVQVKLKNFTLPAGCSTFLCTYGVFRHPMWGSDVDQFRPERWLSPATIPDNPNAFCPFGFGKRSCIGRAYAMMSMKTILVHILRRYQITADVTKLVLRLDAILKAVAGHQISLELRK